MATEAESIQAENEALARRLLELIGPVCLPRATQPSGAAGLTAPLREVDALIAHIEVNDKHGVGVLLRKLFGRHENLLSIRSRDFYDGRQDFGARHLRISHEEGPRDAVFSRVLERLEGATVRRILAVPYFPDDARTALALKEIFGVPLCTYLMDDQNLCCNGIPDGLMDELLAKSSLRLAISPEMYAGYELKYGYKMSFMPPVVSTRLVCPYLNPARPAALKARSGVIVGNIWGQRWLELLRGIVRGSGVTLRWHCNGDFRWLPCDKKALAADGILPHEGPPLPDDEMTEVLRQAAFAVVPSGTLDDSDDRRFIAQLSFPSRIPYILATSQAPILVLGNERTAAARFVMEAGIGISAPYERQAFLAAIEEIARPERNLALRAKALALAARFVDTGAAEWIWQSLALGRPMDRRFEDMLVDRRAEVRHLVSPRAGTGC